MIKKADSNVARVRRHKAIRNKISGTSETPRLNVFKSNSNIYAQIIDDTKGITLVSASTLSKEINVENGGNIEAATEVGKLIAKKDSKEELAIDEYVTILVQVSDPLETKLANTLIANDMKTRKELRNGHIFIVKDNQLYDLFGRKVK